MGQRRVGRGGARWLGPCVFAIGMALAGRAQAHLGSTKYLDVHPSEQGARVVVALEADDAGLALGLGLAPPDDALRARAALLEQWLSSGLSISSGGEPCDARALPMSTSIRDGRRFVELPLDVTCSAERGALVLRDDTVFDDDPDHRAFLTIHDPHGSRVAVLSASEREVSIERERATATTDAWATVATFVREGAWHLVSGLDHVLFVLTLLLGGTLARRRRAFRQAAGLVTAFTVGHSVSLCAAALGWVAVPSGPVEIAIAASVVIAAVMNVVPRRSEAGARARAGVALGFGLLHGLGFASVLGELGLPGAHRVVALLSFNVGIELAQIALAAVALPILAWSASRFRERGRERAVALAGSLAIAAVALVWVVERTAAL